VAGLGSEIDTDGVLASARARFRGGRLLAAAALLVFTAVFLKNAWVDEDAYITFRSIEQLFAGRGPRWNPHERVQVFTHPLWFALLAILRVLTRDLFAVALVASYAGCLAMLAGARRDLHSWAQWALLVMWLIASKSFFDFTSSGLENPLAYALIPPYLIVLRRVLTFERTPSRHDLALLSLLLALLLLTRHDLLLLFAPAHLAAVWRGRDEMRRSLTAVLLGLSPFLVWTLFSLFYYGFPFPNTAYAKLATGIPRGRLLNQGLHYVESLFVDDPVTALTLVAGVVLLPLLHRWRTSAEPRVMGVLVVSGLLLHVAYVISIGGDYMTGRFFSASFLVVALCLVRSIDVDLRSLAGAAVVLVVVAWLWPGSPLLSGRDFRRDRPNVYGIGDQRGILFPISSIHQWLETDANVFPDYHWSSEGRAFARSRERVRVRANVGIMGYTAGTEKIIIDRLALTDPLLARLPSRRVWRIGHFPRHIPDGYGESVETAQPKIVDPGLRAFHEKLRLITQDELLAPGRISAIVGMNLGCFDSLLESAQ